MLCGWQNPMLSNAVRDIWSWSASRKMFVKQRNEVREANTRSVPVLIIKLENKQARGSHAVCHNSDT